ncbi:MAG: hypothetical protein AAFY07_13695, partial [Pseudomonadota bacterium]
KLLPFAMLFVWCAHRLALNRWVLVTAILATVFALIASSFLHENIVQIFYTDTILEMVGLSRFWYLLMPAISVCFVGAFALACWCKGREPTETSE